jgi:hypothetical protein
VLVYLVLFPLSPVASLKLAVHHSILPNRLFRCIRHSLVVALTIRTASTADCGQQLRTKVAQTNVRPSYTELTKSRVPESRCPAFQFRAKKSSIVVEGEPHQHRASKLAMPPPTVSSKARVYTDVNTQKTRDYWDYDAHVPSWR